MARSSRGRCAQGVAALLLAALAPLGAGGAGAPLTGRAAPSRRAFAASLLAAAAAGPLAPTAWREGGGRAWAPGPPAASASYTLYKAASDERTAMLQAGTWKQGFDIDDSEFQGRGARNEAEKIRAFKYKGEAKAGTAGKFCAGQTANVSPMMENLCVRIGTSKADRATQVIDEFGSAQQRNRNVDAK